jgi:hypothetical protein
MGGSRAVDPVTVQVPLFDLAYTKVRDDLGEVESVVEDRIKAFAEVITGASSLQFVLSFFTEKPKDRSLIWQVISGGSKEKVYFERWRIPVTLVVAPGKTNGEFNTSKSVKNVMWFVVRKLSEKMEHLPSTCAALVYPFEIQFEKAKSGEASAWSPRSIASSIKSIPYIT